jgi:putative transposase
MPRIARSLFADQVYHVINRANRRARVFHEDRDYDAFTALMAKAQAFLEIPLVAACLMPNHVHLVVRPAAGSDLSRWMHWVFTTHVRHYHSKFSSDGRVWQGPFKAFPVQSDHYLLTVMRYVERNAQRSNLVRHANDWPWSSLQWRAKGRGPLELAPSPVALPSYWVEFVNQAQTAAEVDAIRTSVNRQRPFGDPDWVSQTARAAGSEQTLSSIGRPRKAREP